MNSTIDQYLDIYNSIDFEQIKDHPNILIAARFWDDARYKAAKTCYKFMRAIDDLIDNHKSEYMGFSEDEKNDFCRKVDLWIDQINKPGTDNPLQAELIKTMNNFLIPAWPMRNFAKSMIYDIYNDGFSSIDAFIEYAEGASIAPASVFVHLSGLVEENSHYKNPRFDVKRAASPCAIFSYLVHIIRDFEKDQTGNLNYFADDLIKKYNLSRELLKEIASGAAVPQGFRDMINEYYLLADHYRQKTYDIIKEIKPLVDARYQLSLEIIFNLYLMVFERIDIKNGSFTAKELNPTPDEIKDRVYRVIKDFQAV
jgi:phytoene/squalene synthetase